MKQVDAPGVAAVAVAGDENHGGTTLPATRQVERAVAANIRQPGDITARRGG
jgi:hypothetical protein